MRLYLGYCGFVAKLPRHSQLFERILSRPNSKLLEEDKNAILIPAPTRGRKQAK